MKHFVLLVEYLSGECAFPTDKDNLIDALKEFEEEQRSIYNGAMGDKTFALPMILSAKIVKTYYRKN